MWAREFFVVQRDRTIGLINCDEGFIEVAVFNRVIGALLANQSEFIQIFTIDALKGCDRIGANALMWLRVNIAQSEIVVIEKGEPFPPPEPARDIISVPPPMVKSSMPAMILAAAILTDVIPEPQKRSSVTPLALTS